jgi:hypothetical protein
VALTLARSDTGVRHVRQRARRIRHPYPANKNDGATQALVFGGSGASYFLVSRGSGIIEGGLLLGSRRFDPDHRARTGIGGARG